MRTRLLTTPLLVLLGLLVLCCTVQGIKLEETSENDLGKLQQRKPTPPAPVPPPPYVRPPMYNILNLCGGGIRGIIPAVVIDHIETYAFEYGLQRNYSAIVQRNKTNAPKRI